MEYIIKSKESAIPCSVTIDEDNGKYMIRNADTTGEVFGNKNELLTWIEKNWHPHSFENEMAYYELLSMIKHETEKFN